MRTITFVNEKGGVGKTTLSTTLAAGLAIAGYRVMLVDADPQGHAGVSLGVGKAPALFDLMVRKKPWEEVVVEIPRERYVVPDEASQVEGNLFVVRSNIETRAILSALQDGDLFALLKYLVQLDGVIDYVICDTSPTPSMFHTTVYMATDALIYPSEMSSLSLDGLRESLDRLDTANKLRASEGLPEIELHGVIPNKTRLRTIVHTSKIAQVKEAFPDSVVYSPIALRTDWEGAVEAERSIFSYAPLDSAADSAARFVNEFLEREGVSVRV